MIIKTVSAVNTYGDAIIYQKHIQHTSGQIIYPITPTSSQSYKKISVVQYVIFDIIHINISFIRFNTGKLNDLQSMDLSHKT